MDKNSITSQVNSFINEEFVFDSSTKPDKNDSLMDNGIIDSAGMLTLISFLEETFQISIEDEELTRENLDSIENISDFIERKLN
jgi:acyl carrier protein